MNIFILEDDPSRMKLFNEWFKDHEIDHSDWAGDAINSLRSIKYDVIFLDHDLGGQAFVDSNDPNTGYQVAKTIPDGINANTPVIVHSMNPAGGKNILDVLTTPQKIHSPFGTQLRNIISS